MRSGGAFDPAGARSVDVQHADRLVYLVDENPGRWAMVTLTVNRLLFLSAEMAYQRCNERVREVMRGLRSEFGVSLYFVVFEVQKKTGEGWPHWHVMVLLPDGAEVGEVEARVRRLWALKVERVDEETGEVVGVVRESIGFSDVSLCRSAGGSGRYVAKYLTKPWRAVPEWMGRSHRQLRKVRAGVGCFDWWERHGRHERKRERRRAAVPPVKPRVKRSLFHRMARSGAVLSVMRKVDGKLSYVGSAWGVLSDDRLAGLCARGGKVLRAGPWARMRYELSPAAVEWLRQDDEATAREVEFARRLHESAWERCQGDSGGGCGGLPHGQGIGGAVAVGAT